MLLTSWRLIVLVCGLISCTAVTEEESSEESGQSSTGLTTAEIQQNQNSHYNLNQPDEEFNLPENLREISGIAYGPDNTIYCIQDENGTVYQYHLKVREIVDKIEFGDKGDYEDLYFHNDEIMILRSDGTIFSINSKGKNISQRKLASNCDNNEGFTFDKSSGLYFMACKDGSEDDKRIINKYSRNGSDFKKESTLIIETSEVKKHHNYSGKTEFNPSAIAVHPISNAIYILSSEGIMVVWKNNKIEKVYSVPSKIYHNAEGLAFAPNGDLYISSEGEGSGKPAGKLFYLKYHK